MNKSVKEEENDEILNTKDEQIITNQWM